MIQAARGQRDLIKVNGTDYATPDGTCVRDYIHVTDLASGHIAAVQHLQKTAQAGVQAINLGTGQGQSVRQVIDSVQQISGKSFPVEEGPRRRGDPAMLVAEVRRARKFLGWQARHSDLGKIIRDAWAYAEANL